MKKVVFLLITAFALFAFTPNLLINKSFQLAGKFYYYPFYEQNDPKNAFNWVFETPDNKIYRLMGSEPSENNVFGWKEVRNLQLGDPQWLFFYLGDIDNDGDTRFDWVIIPAKNQRQILYKLMEVTPDEHYFRYDGPYLVRYRFDGKVLHIGQNYAKRLDVPFREHGYSQLDDFIFITNSYDLNRFIKEVQNQPHWNNKNLFLSKLQTLDLQNYNLVIYHFAEPSGSIRVAVTKERFIAPNVFEVTLITERPEIGTADMAYYALAYLVDKKTQRLVVKMDGKEKVYRLKEEYRCSTIDAPVCGYRPIECITTPCPAMPVHQETFKNYCELKKAGAVYIADGECSAQKRVDDKRLANNINTFSYNLTSDIYNGSGNILLSPYSLARALEMVYLGSAGDTKVEIENILGKDLELAKSFEELAPKVKSNELAEANSIWFEKEMEVYPSYIYKVQDFLDASPFSADFIHNAEAERLRINAWVEEQTRGKIKELLPYNSVRADMRALLVNALYFKGTWEHPFDEQNTHKGQFLGENGVVWVDMMTQEGTFAFMQNDRLKAIELPYKDHELSMFILLPKGNLCVCDMIDYLKRHTLQEIRGQMKMRDVLVRIPKFTLEWGAKDLSTNLKHIGFETLFDPERSDLRFIGKPLKPTDRLALKFLFHKVRLEVTENGSEGAAATAAGVVEVTAAPISPKTEFIVDHNFLFLIVDNRTDAILFLGGIKRL